MNDTEYESNIQEIEIVFMENYTDEIIKINDHIRVEFDIIKD